MLEPRKRKSSPISPSTRANVKPTSNAGRAFVQWNAQPAQQAIKEVIARQVINE
jgi:hypothetical protein